jgi:hypothetical protein
VREYVRALGVGLAAWIALCLLAFTLGDAHAALRGSITLGEFILEIGLVMAIGVVWDLRGGSFVGLTATSRWSAARSRSRCISLGRICRS